jgi:hypothetical protein
MVSSYQKFYLRGEIKYMPYGNHARAKFYNWSHPRLLKSWKILSMKCVCKFLDSFLEEWMWCTTLCRIRKWKKLLCCRVKRAASEPTHIDPTLPYFRMEGISATYYIICMKSVWLTIEWRTLLKA